MTSSFDLICLGSGPAAVTVAKACAKQNLRVAVVESGEFGGTCALHGCNPKKVFTNAAALHAQFQQAIGRLVQGDNIGIAWSDLVAFQHTFTNPVRDDAESNLRTLGIETFHGPAQFAGEQVIQVGDSLLKAESIFVGVGASPAPLNITGEEFVVTSDSFMGLPHLPPRVVFLGGGYISFEFANVALRAGSDVTIVDRNEAPLGSFDPDLVRLLTACSVKSGIKILAATEVQSVKRQGSHFEVMFESKGRIESIQTELVVHGGGRVPNTRSLQLAAGNVASTERGVTINPYLQSPTNPKVYAAGDCADTGVQMLTPTANESARVAGINILACRQSMTSRQQNVGSTRQVVDYGSVPQVVFSVPPLAAVGLSESEARRQGFDLDVRYEDLSTKGEVRKLCALAAGCKLIVDRRTSRLLGAHLLGPHAEEVINLFALAMRGQLTVAQLKSTLFTYPTMTAEYTLLL